jgi:hypothetical protein
MPLSKEQIVSAQVTLRAASGKQPHKRSIITAETLKEFLPSAESAARVRKVLGAMGFEVGGLVGNSLSISGPVRFFETVFQSRLCHVEKGGIQFLNADQSCTYELPREKIPPTLKELVVSVTFTPPPDFGPTAFSSLA